MTQIRPRIDDDLAAEVQAYADSYKISFTDAVKILLRAGLQTARPSKEMAPDEHHDTPHPARA